MPNIYTTQELWEDFAVRCIKNADPERLEQLRGVFFSGAFAMYCLMDHAIKEQDATRMMMLCSEMDKFQEGFPGVKG